MSYLQEVPSTTNGNIRDARGQIAFSQVVDDEATMIKRPEKFNVYIRLKPLNVLEVSDKLNDDCFSVQGNELTTKMSNSKNETVKSKYSFTKVFMPSTPQSAIFDTAVKSNLEMFLGGDNSLVFAYGTSGSGKTYTMQGTYTEPGIIPRILFSIFQAIEGHEDSTGRYYPDGSNVFINNEDQADENLKYKKKILNLAKKQVYKTQEKLDQNDTISYASHKNMNKCLTGLKKIRVEATKDTLFSVWISMCEIHNENLNDLLVQRDDQVQLRLIEDNSTIIVKGLKQINVSTWEEAYEVYRYGKHNLHVSETNINKKSSRSHCIFNIKLVKRNARKPTKFENVSSFMVCDLAGSERMTKIGSRKNISKEATGINTSLFVLNKCIELIRKNQQMGTSLRIPFRESKLTRLLSKNLLGDGTVNIIVNITQEGDFTGETEQTLRATANASEIVIKPFREPNKKIQMAVSVESLENLHLDEINDQKSIIEKQQREIDDLKRLLVKERETVENFKRKENDSLKLTHEIMDLRYRIDLLESEKEDFEVQIHNGKLDLISCFNIPGEPGLEEAVRYACKKITTYRHYYKLMEQEYEDKIDEYEKEIGILRGMVMNLEEKEKEQEILNSITVENVLSDEDLTISSEKRKERVLAEKENVEVNNSSIKSSKKSDVTPPTQDTEVSEVDLKKTLPAQDTQVSEVDLKKTLPAQDTEVSEEVVKKCTRKKLLPKTQDDYLGDDSIPIETPRRERALSTNTLIKNLKKQ